MSKITEESIRMQFKKGSLIDETWLLNHAHFTQSEIDELVDEGVLTLIPKDPNDKMSDNRYLLN